MVRERFDLRIFHEEMVRSGMPEKEAAILGNWLEKIALSSKSNGISHKDIEKIKEEIHKVEKEPKKLRKLIERLEPKIDLTRDDLHDLEVSTQKELRAMDKNIADLKNLINENQVEYNKSIDSVKKLMNDKQFETHAVINDKHNETNRWMLAFFMAFVAIIVSIILGMKYFS